MIHHEAKLTSMSALRDTQISTCYYARQAALAYESTVSEQLRTIANEVTDIGDKLVKIGYQPSDIQQQ